MYITLPKAQALLIFEMGPILSSLSMFGADIRLLNIPEYNDLTKEITNI